ncbi:hypothetical protein TSUD_270460 [Trifolium subterraneum]|uniref:Reverse transcriptase domain-containing protein n=1 Tax=Trifolium subterraneum TaxID=3900 RepID=A0A2Z6NRZ8_TRISU|nr:hypothetical protein TSUD_270460 [Trifolium subterraneum]
MWWSQRSRAMWLKHGDKNTSYFHQKANQRRRTNKIENICDSSGTIHYDPTKIEEIMVNHFKTLFESQDTHHTQRTVEVVRNSITKDQYKHLDEAFTEEEVAEAIRNMKGLAAPGPDGLPALFYHTYWDIIKKEVTTTALQVLNHKGDTTPYNHTYICLIPKKKNPSLPSDHFRPISLCNVILKIITKTIANRIKVILPEVISPNQSALTTPWVEWKFLQLTLETMGFPKNVTDTIMNCVKQVMFSILINGKPTQRFKPQRGLRQGDPLSPYLFILCANVFSGLITKAQNDKRIHGVKIAHGAPEVSHLLFADDSLLFCRANTQEATVIHNIISEYQEASETGNKTVSYTWRSISKASWILKKGGLWNIGNGANINIWTDNWLPRQQGHKIWTPRGEATQIWVKDLMYPEIRSWNRQLISDTFMPFEAEQIVQIPIVHLSNPDEFSWPSTKDGIYTKLWKLKIPPKYTHLLWRILQDALPIQTNLRKRAKPKIASLSTNIIRRKPLRRPVPPKIAVMAVGGWGVRRVDGSWVGAATKVVEGIEDVAAAEAMGVMEAITSALLIHQGPIIIENDNEVIMKAINLKKFPRLLWGQLAKQIRVLIDANPQLSIQWVGRNRNTVAHVIAEWAEVEPNKTWVDNLPPHIVGHIQRDMMPPICNPIS